MRRLLTPDLIEGHDIYMDLMPEVAGPLVAALISQKFKIDNDLAALNRLFPGFGSFGYRIRSRRLAASTNGKVPCSVCYHEGLHNLIGNCFGVGLKGRPLMTLFNECCGQGLEIYITAILGKYTDANLSHFSEYRSFKNNAKLLKVSFRSLFNLAKKNPYGAFVTYVSASFEMHRKFFDLLKLSEGKRTTVPAKIIAVHSRSKGLALCRENDLSVAACFVASNCGFRSTAEDQKSLKTCQRFLKESKSLGEFLGKVARGV